MYENVLPNLVLILLFVHTEVECRKGLLDNNIVNDDDDDDDDDKDGADDDDVS